MKLRELAGKKEAGLVFLIALIYSIYLHNRLGMDGFWDTANYHLYLGWAFWHAPSYGLGAVAQYQTFLNPIIDAINYPLFSIHPFLGAAFHSACLALAVVVVYRVAVKTFGPGETTRYAPVMATVIGATGAMTVSLFGSLTNEHITALLILSGLAGLVVWTGTPKERTAMFVAGLLMGIAAGLKLTAAPYVAGLLLAVAVTSKFHVKWLCLLVAGVALGLLLADGVFMAWRWNAYHNPIFPLANNVFHSPYFPLEWKSFGRFELSKLPYYLSLPARWLYSGDFSESNIVRDGRLLLGYIGVAMAVFSAESQRKKLTKEERLVILFFVFSWLAWILFFRIYRYLVVLELLSGVVFVIGLVRVFPPAHVRLRIVLSVMALGFLWSVTVYPDWGRRPWAKEFATTNLLKQVEGNKGNVVFFSDERVSYLAPELDAKKIPFRNLFAQPWYDGDRLGNPIDPKSIALPKGGKVYFLQYSMDDPRGKSKYLASVFDQHMYRCEKLVTNMMWSANLCHFEHLRDLPQTTVGPTYDHASSALVFGAGWSSAEPAFRWTEAHTATMWVSLPVVSASCPLSVSIKGSTLGKQRMEIAIAGQDLSKQDFSGPVDVTLRLNPAKLTAGQPVQVILNLPDAAAPQNGDPRILAFAFQGLRFGCD